MIEKKITASQDFQLKLPSYKNILIALGIATLLLMPEMVFEMCSNIAGLIFDGLAFLLYQLFHELIGLTRVQSDMIVGSTFIGVGVISLIMISFQYKKIYSWATNKTAIFVDVQKNQLRSVWDKTSRLNKFLFCIVYLPFSLFCMSFLII